MARRSAASTAPSCLDSALGVLGRAASGAGRTGGESIEADGEPESRCSPQATSAGTLAAAAVTHTSLRTGTPNMIARLRLAGAPQSATTNLASPRGSE